MRFDKDKSQLEVSIEKCIEILSRTYPEQVQDAMEDYVKVLVLLRKQEDWRVLDIVDQLQRLYVYPNREEHNHMLNDVHELKEELHEERVQQSLLKQNKEPEPKTELSGWQPSKKNLMFLLLGGTLLWLVIKKG